MGIELITKIKNKCTKEMKFAFLFTFIGGLLVHMYKFTNNLPNHDSLYNFYSDQNVIGSGRWFLSIACGFSSYYDLPWLNGLLSILFISLTAVVLIHILKIKNPIVIFISCGLLVTYPPVVETLCFAFTADGYMLAMLFSALSVYFIIKINNNFKSIAVGSILLCLTCAIYQAYVSFAIVLFLCWFILSLFTQNNPVKNYLTPILRFAFSLLIGLSLFYTIWKLSLFVFQVPINDYQGINNMGLLGFNELFLSIKKVITAFITIIFEKNILKHGISLYGVFNIIFIFSAIIILIISIKKAKIHKNPSKLLSLIASLIFMPFSVCLWQFVSSEVVYSFRMMQSVVLIFILFVVLCEQYIKNYFATIFAILNILIIANLSVQANVAYYYLNYEYENTYAEAVQLEFELNKICAKYDNKYPIAIIGHRETEVALDQTTEANGCFMYTSMIEKSLLLDSIHTENFLKNVLYFDKEFVNSKTAEKIQKTTEYSNMTPWFNGGNIEIIDNVITVKLG